MVRLVDCVVAENVEVARDTFLLRLGECDVGRVEPGQFVMVKVDGLEIPLRRPFSVYDVDEVSRSIKVLYRVVGRGTAAMAALRAGDVVSVLGPLGRGFPVKEKARAVLLARGVGMASLVLLGKELKARGNRVVVIASFRDREQDFASRDPLIRSFADELVALYDAEGTSDVSNVESLLRSLGPDVVYTCGSRRLARLLQKLPYEAYVSLEEVMGCGLGACMSCAVKTVTGYRLVCRDGPVFDVREVVL
ncbi:MAG: dihydroorotate dehydrogenase electron transfer subunit [Desulfurococcaceae archaeon]